MIYINKLWSVFLVLGLFASGLLGLILLIVGTCVKVRDKKRGKKSKESRALFILGAIYLLPITIIATIIIITETKENIRQNKSLNYQVSYGTVEKMEKILSSGVNPDCKWITLEDNIVAIDGEYTLLCYLCFSKRTPDYIEKIELLIDYGADVNRKVYMYHYTPEEHLGEKYHESIGGNDGCGKTPLMIACNSGNYSVVKVLIENGADVNATDFCGESALIYATKVSGYRVSDEVRVRIAKLLLENGADKSVEGKYTGTALEVAESQYWDEMVEVLS